MTAFNMTPDFNDSDSCRKWMKTWKMAYNRLTSDIQKKRTSLQEMQRAGVKCNREHRDLHYARQTARKLMMLRDEAKLRIQHIRKMRDDLAAQNSKFPLDFGNCSRIDFHFNKIALSFPFIPNWMLKIKGNTYYVTDVVSEVGFSTRNRPQGSTRGMLRFPSGKVSIDSDGIAHIK